MNESYTSSQTVLFWGLFVALPLGLFLIWYALRLLKAAERASDVSVPYFLLGGIGMITAVFGGLFGTVAFIIMLANGLSLWWLLIPGAAAAHGLWYGEHWITARQARFEVQQFSLVSEKQMPLGNPFVYRSYGDAVRAAACYQAITSHSYFRVLDHKTGEYVA